VPTAYIHIDNSSKAVSSYVNKVVSKAIDSVGGFTRSQHGAVQNMLVKMLRNKIYSMSSITGEKSRLVASGNMMRTANYKLNGFEFSNSAFNYTYGLNMVWYGFMLGNDTEFNFTKSKSAIAEWIKLKMKLGVQFKACKWKKKKGVNWRKYSPSDYTKKCKAASEADAIMIASQMVNKITMTRVIPNWFELRKEDVGWDEMRRNIITSKNLIPAVTDRVAKEINKYNG
jgi:hypothetical protein